MELRAGHAARLDGGDEAVPLVLCPRHQRVVGNRWPTGRIPSVHSVGMHEVEPSTGQPGEDALVGGSCDGVPPHVRQPPRGQPLHGAGEDPDAGRVDNKLGLEEDNQNFLLMYSISVNVSGQIASVIAGGLLLTLLS